MIQSYELGPHPSLVPQEIPLPSLHEANKRPEGCRIVLQYWVDGGQKITHTLHITQIGIVLIMSKAYLSSAPSERWCQFRRTEDQGPDAVYPHPQRLARHDRYGEPPSLYFVPEPLNQFTCFVAL